MATIPRRRQRIKAASSTTASDQSTKAHISLAGSTAIVSEFFSYAVNSILFQRGLYPPEDFKMVKKYGLNMLVTNDDGLKGYLEGIIKQLEGALPFVSAGQKALMSLLSSQLGC